jgi:type II secretory pathway component PulC
MTRISRLVVIGLCAAAALALAAEQAAPPFTHASDSLESSRRRDEQLTAKKADVLVAEVLKRPLFSQSRRPPQPRIVKAEPPKLQGRLAGLVVQSDDRQALFSRPGSRPITVREGDTIDGWTVGKIEADRVLLTSAFGDQVVTPTNGAPDEITTPAPRSVLKKNIPTQAPSAKMLPPSKRANLSFPSQPGAAAMAQAGWPGP